MFEEMNEFYAFQEVEQLTENLRMWQQTGDFNGGTSVHNPTVVSLRLIEIRWGVWVGLISNNNNYHYHYTEWTGTSPSQRKMYVVSLLENLEHQDSFMRYATARRLLYLLQGTSTRIPFALHIIKAKNDRHICGDDLARAPDALDH